jgi:chemotaxis regulatin CheY-phosphate phosphatase CheZ
VTKWPDYDDLPALDVLRERMWREVARNMDRQAALMFDANQGRGYWEATLARQIEERRVRHWPRRVRGYLSRRGRDYASRLSLAYQALRGNHYCGDDDW